MIEHRNLLNYLHNCAAVFGIGPGDTVYGLTAVTFDIAVMELVCSLLIGCRLVLEEAVHDMDAVAARIRDERVSVLQMTPSRLRAYLERNAVTTLASVRVMLVGGEPLTPMLLDELRKLDCTRVFHVYGPTETTVWSSASLISGAPVSLGRPLAGEEIFILSRDAKLMPRGLPGEICIAGEGVGRGYLNRPELTVQQFTSVPFLPGKRVYRTGDLGCIALDGELSFLGRNDSQVKIQGVRVEIGEIENQLLRHGGVSDAAVLACDKEGGGKALWACVVSDVGEAALRRYLADSFPYYMIPEVFVFLESLPLTVNGKTDRQALIKVASSFIPPPHGSREPTLVESQLMEFWRAALKLPAPPGTGDNFFALGGNSLKAAQVIGQIQAVFGVALELRDFFTGPTIEEIGQLIEAIAWSASGGNGAPGTDEKFII
jgi:acyl-CoA synthetase (AMP-forming)/AMP-acid ligase II/acyl carrier protein